HKIVMVFDKSFTVAARPVAPLALQTAALSSIQQVAGKANTLKELALEFQENFEASQGFGWHVLVGKDFAIDVRYRKGCCVVLLHKSTSTKVVLYRATNTSATPKLSSNIPEEAKDLKCTVVESNMDKERQAKFTSMCLRLATYDSTEDMVTDLKAWLVQSFGNTWHVAAAANRDLCGAIHANPGTYCDVMLTKGKQCTRFVVFQNSGYDSTIDLLTLLHRIALVIAAMAGVVFLFYKTAYRVECLQEDNAGCTEDEITVAKAGEWWQFVATLGVVVMIAFILHSSTNNSSPKMSDEIKTRRSKKSDKARRNFELNGKYSAKHVRRTNQTTPSVETSAPKQLKTMQNQPDAAPEAVYRKVEERPIVMGQWESKVFGCFDTIFPNCLMATFCHCVSLAQIAQRLDIYPFQKVLYGVGGIWCAAILCAILTRVGRFFYFLEIVFILMALVFYYRFRTQVRFLFQIPGTHMEDCAYSFFCSCCSIAQMATQAHTYEPGQCSFSGKSTLPGYSTTAV
ncbi:hypothetical protein THRCLA_06627, partial [Thraustotheca clavata]